MRENKIPHESGMALILTIGIASEMKQKFLTSRVWGIIVGQDRTDTHTDRFMDRETDISKDISFQII